MKEIQVGNMIKIRDRKDWPTPPGYLLANSEGEVTSVGEEDGFVTIHLKKTNSKIPLETTLALRLENVEKLEPGVK